MLLILCLVSLFAQSFAQFTVIPCPNPRNFDFSRLLGTWFEYGRTPNLFEPGHVCTNFTHYVDDNNVAVMNVDGTIQVSGARYIFEAELLPTETNGIFYLKYPWYASVDRLPGAFVDANWDSWVIFVLCTEESRTHLRDAWILTKHRQLPRKHMDQIARALRRINLSWNHFEISDNQNCPRRRPLVRIFD